MSFLALRDLANEFLFGASGGRKLSLHSDWALVLGPEIFGETTFRAFFNGATDIEGLLTARFERIGQGRQLRMKLGIGHGIFNISGHRNGESWSAWSYSATGLVKAIGCPPTSVAIRCTCKFRRKKIIRR
jgi:hypothetical protein